MAEPDIDELDDGMLLRFVETVFPLPKMATANGSTVRFQYTPAANADDLRAMLRHLDPRTLRGMSIYRTLDLMEAVFPIGTKDTGEMLQVRITFRDHGATDVSVARCNLRRHLWDS